MGKTDDLQALQRQRADLEAQLLEINSKELWTIGKSSICTKACKTE